MTHLTKDYIACRLRVALEDQRCSTQGGYQGDGDDDEGSDATAGCAMLIFGDPQAYQDRRLQKLTHRQVYAAALAALLYLC